MWSLLCSEFLLIHHHFICQTFQSAAISEYQYNVKVLVNPPYSLKTNCGGLMSIHCITSTHCTCEGYIKCSVDLSLYVLCMHQFVYCMSVVYRTVIV